MTVKKPEITMYPPVNAGGTEEIPSFLNKYGEIFKTSSESLEDAARRDMARWYNNLCDSPPFENPTGEGLVELLLDPSYRSWIQYLYANVSEG